MSDQLELWLAALPVDEAVVVDGETVWLRPHPHGAEPGAELGVVLLRQFTPAQLEEAARAGFHTARQFGAGLAVQDDALVLNRWLAGVDGWLDAAGALEDILNQSALWRAWLAPGRPRREEGVSAQEQRIRARFTGGLP
ncbi:hypothetical protein ACFFTM_08850 [Pseudoduganella plicata]|uniref:Type III secretion protein n=1 Tax=Pseudoduganella plicata TaxID=321984 RepID=A0A4P7BAG0_9BURK|nr:hypothetical protein [Pseudoduganella plicata]QBQ35414.1 hypothetical protein E1742_03970 [Pseudoduganella plicata]GGZ01555.1 hypothetical protein GCM10007388_39080 [Pseudoduganella plicata]